MTGISLIFYALVVVSKMPDASDQVIAVYQTREHCMYEAQQIITQGPSAYCVPVNQFSEKDPNEQVNSVMRLTRGHHDLSSN
jgi:hypothetical protein